MFIREANTNDAEIISLLARVTFDETFGHLFRDRQDLLDYFDHTFSVPKIRASLEKDNNVYWVAFVNELPVGYAKLKVRSTIEFSKEKEISQLQKIYVLKDFLARKIGKHLQEALFQKAIAYGSKELWLSVLHNNERAVRFYEKSNYRKIGEHDFSIGKETFRFIALSKQM